MTTVGEVVGLREANVWLDDSFKMRDVAEVRIAALLGILRDFRCRLMVQDPKSDSEDFN